VFPFLVFAMRPCPISYLVVADGAEIHEALCVVERGLDCRDVRLGELVLQLEDLSDAECCK